MCTVKLMRIRVDAHFLELCELVETSLNLVIHFLHGMNPIKRFCATKIEIPSVSDLTPSKKGRPTGRPLQVFLNDLVSAHAAALLLKRSHARLIAGIRRYRRSGSCRLCSRSLLLSRLFCLHLLKLTLTRGKVVARRCCRRGLGCRLASRLATVVSRCRNRILTSLFRFFRLSTASRFCITSALFCSGDRIATRLHRVLLAFNSGLASSLCLRLGKRMCRRLENGIRICRIAEYISRIATLSLSIFERTLCPGIACNRRKERHLQVLDLCGEFIDTIRIVYHHVINTSLVFKTVRATDRRFRIGNDNVKLVVVHAVEKQVFVSLRSLYVTFGDKRPRCVIHTDGEVVVTPRRFCKR